MSSTVKANKWLHSDGTETTEVDVPSLGPVMAKAWGNFDGIGSEGLRDSYNVSSVTDVGTGNYTFNLTNARPDHDYCVVVGHQRTNYDDMSQSIQSQNTASAVRYEHFGAGVVKDTDAAWFIMFDN